MIVSESGGGRREKGEVVIVKIICLFASVDTERKQKSASAAGAGLDFLRGA